jgi:transcriptional regulator with XRE-family HTH domain
MTDNGKYTELGQYIVALVDSHNLSLRKASLRSGLDATTIARILQRDGTNIPTPETLQKLADGLGGDFYRMMALAGHLPPADATDEMEAELYAKFQRLQELVRQVAQRDPEEAKRLMGMVITPFEIMLALEGREVGEYVEREREEVL